jgi:hypothetical protein
MRPRIPALATFLVALLLAAPAAHAAKTAGTFTPIEGSPELSALKVGRALSASSACLLGETRPVIGYLPYVIPPEDRYFTLIDPASCTACPAAGGVAVTVGHMGIYFPTLCTTLMTVSVVGAMATPIGGCYVPDESNVLCPPVTYAVTPPTSGGFDVGLPLDPGCCISDKAFLRIDFLQSGCDPSTGALGIYATAAPCYPCQSWNFYASAQDDLCSVFSQYGAGNLYMYAEADCCGATPTHDGSWGRVKTLYR